MHCTLYHFYCRGCIWKINISLSSWTSPCCCLVMQWQLSEAEYSWHSVAAACSSSILHLVLRGLVRPLVLEVYHNATWVWRWSKVLRHQAELANQSAPVGGIRISSYVLTVVGGSQAISAVCLSFILSFCVQDYYKSNQPISLKLGAIIGPTSWKNWLTFDSDAVPDTYSRSLPSPLQYRKFCRIY